MSRHRWLVVVVAGLLLVGILVCRNWWNRPAEPPPKNLNKAEGTKVVEDFLDSVVALRNQLDQCQAEKSRYEKLGGKNEIKKGTQSVALLLKMIEDDENWLAKLEKQAPDQFNQSTYLTLKRFRELAAEWRTESAKIKVEADKLKTFWEEEEKKRR
jgi:hypothetical protein